MRETRMLPARARPRTLRRLPYGVEFRMAMRRRPHLASALEIEHWADSLEARGELPRLVRRLIRQTNDQVLVLDMGAGEATGAAGYDGMVEAQKGTPIVPAGNSVWEIGTGNDPQRKANEDYASRTDDPLGVDPAETTFVFVTCRRWDGKRDWRDAKRRENKWRDVRAFDVQDLEIALESAIAAHVWLSEVLNKPVVGIETIEEWWERFSNSTLPMATAELVLTQRADEASMLLTFLAREPQLITVSAPSQDDVIAFVAAVILTSPEEGRVDLLARTLVVHDEYSLRQLDSEADLLILVPLTEELRREALLVRSHHVVLLAEGDAPADIPLSAIAIEPATSLLRDIGVDEERAAELAQAANRSLIAFQREAPARPGIARRDWSEFFRSKVVRRAWLMGGWTEQRTGDIEMVSSILGMSYDDARDELLQSSRGPDPLFTLTGGQWARILPEAAFAYGEPSISASDLQSVERAIQTVLGAVDPALELPVSERWKASLYGKTRIHSSTLRDGLATTLGLLGALGNSLILGGGRTGQTWAESATFHLLDRANGDKSGQLWASLADVLPLLAEAAPDVFLRAVQEGLTGEQPLLQELFLDKAQGEAISVSSPHTGLLWALEGIAWSAEHLGLASELLARLAEIDPGGRLSNRPRNSLASVFRTWLPQTSTSLETRLRVIDGICARHSEVGWHLLLDLLPEPNEVGSYSHAPRFRQWKPRDLTVTRREFAEARSAVAERLLTMAGRDGSRLAQLIGRIDDFPAPRRRVALDHLGVFARDSTVSDQDRVGIWDAITAVVRHHRSFPDADWAMPSEDTDRLSQIGDAFRPEDPVATNLWLFKAYVAELGEGKRSNLEDYEKRVREMREQAVRSILDKEGLDGLMRTAEAVEAPEFVGDAVASSEVDDEFMLDLLDSTDSKKSDLAQGFARRRTASRGWQWIDWALRRVRGRPIAQARILGMSGDLPRAWKRLEELGDEVERAYWREFVPYGRGRGFSLVNEAVEQLLRHSRVAIAIDALAMYSHGEAVEIDPELAARALEMLIERQGQDPEITRVSNYEIETLLDYIRPRIDEERVGLLEWRLLPALGPFVASPVLERRLARDPAFFVEVLSLCYRPRNGEPEREIPPAVASNAWHLLQQWKIVPGSEEPSGAVDEPQLRIWIEEARTRARTVDRAEVGDIHIGQIFAQSRVDDDETWPTRPIRNVIEEVASPELEDGLRTGTYNKRGVTSRSLTEGGQQERNLAATYRGYAALIHEAWPRTAAILRSLADNYESEARSHDEQAERTLKGVDR
jgi:hypothetical protein